VFDELGGGVFRRRYESLDLNVGVVVGEDGVLIVDSRAHRVEAEELRAELETLTALPVRWVVNTHYHWDHTFGNGQFAGAEIWGHARCRQVLVTRGDEMKESAKTWLAHEFHHLVDEVVIEPPNRVFSTQASLEVGRRVELSYHGLGHTDSDIVVRIPDADVSFAGDLVEEGAPPNFADSYPVMWPLTLRLGIEDLGGVVVPGHGDVVGRDFVMAQHDQLVLVAELATQVIDGEVSAEDAAGQGPYPRDVMLSAIARAREVA
jgi:glyoxylase-like metal-dependent hydrolase (beta-lactamase superfamily II)